VFGELLRAHLQPILERFQFVLCNRKTEASAFDLLNAIYMHLPIELYQPHLKTLMTVLLTRLQSSKSPKFKKDFVISCSLCGHRNATNLLSQLLNEIQPGLLSNLLANVWMPVLKMSLKLDERKVCAMGMGKLMALDEVKQNPQLFVGCCAALVNVLGLNPSSGTAVVEEGSDDELAPPDGGAGLECEASFSKLRNTDLPGAQGGLAPDIPDLHAAAKALMKPQFGQAVLQLAQGNPELQPLATFFASA
jgi:exportin-2 (importin alpha re-exporter)